MSALIGGVPHPGRIARPRMLGLGARGRPFAWHVSGAYPRRPLRFRLRQAAAARIACSSDPLSDDYDEGPSHSASTSDVGTGMSMFAAVSAAGGAAASGGREKGQIQQQRGGKEPGDGKNINIIDQAKQQYQKLYDRVYYGDVLPPIGPFQISYARLLQLMRARRVKRIVLLSDGRTAIVDVPVENTESNFETMKYDRRDLSITYCEEQPEWMMEKNRYYCELPGDVWEQGTFMELILENQEQRFYAPDGAVRVPYWSLLRTNEVRPELQVVDPGDALVWLNQYSGQFLPIIGLLLLRVVIAGGDWLLRKLGKERKSEQEQLAEQLGSHRAREFNVPGADGKKKGGKKQDTGVRYADVAGIDAIKGDIQEIIEILLGNQEYRAMGASPIRGVLLEGPPGTGKTLLAKAMAGEAGIPFFSANGAEFVEMFQGVAAARIRSLFRAARKNAPAIIFIDEIDAIGKARSDGPTDPGTQEREQGLLQLLAEMDGFVRDDQVLVIGATNRATALDEALLRPGRFDRSIYMGRPSPSNRLKVLQVHARNKPISHDNDDALLRTVADLTIGYSGAELANLLNEAAILAVRKDQKEIDLAVLKEAMDKVRLGLPHTSLPDTPAKRRYATIEAARAVAFAVTPGLPPIEHVTIRPRGNTVARILFVPQEYRSDGGAWQKLGWGRQQSNAVQLDKPLTQFELACGLMVPLYAARACEEVLYGKEGVSLTTSKEVSRAAELARWIVVDSKLHPVNRESPVLSNMAMGGYEDPTTMWMDGQHDEEIMALQRAAYERATRLVEERRPVIEAVGRELCENSDETVLGTRLVELLKATPLAPSPMAEAFAAAAAAVAANGATNAPQEGEDREQPAGEAAPAAANGNGATGATSTAGRRAAAEVLGDSVLQDSQLQQLAEVVMGRIENFDLLPKNLARTKAQQVREQLLDEETRRRLESIQEFIAATDNSLKPSNGTGFPAPPAVPEDKGEALDAWTPKQIDVIEV